MVTKEQVVEALSPDELDYPGIAAALGPEALPVLAELVVGPRPDLAAKATYLAALIPGKGQTEALMLAARSSEPTVRLASATSLESLPDPVATELAPDLLRDADVGVRHHAAKHAARVAAHPAVRAALGRLARDDPNPTLRDFVIETYHVKP
jgi:HEAT repeat protein